MVIFKPIALLAALSPAILAGCGAQHLETVRTAKRQLVGKDAAVLAQCIGEPMAVRALEGQPGSSHLYSSAQTRGANGRLLASPLPGSRAQAEACVFEVTVQDGRIAAVHSDNRAGWGFGSITNCSAVVERCVSN